MVLLDLAMGARGWLRPVPCVLRYWEGFSLTLQECYAGMKGSYEEARGRLMTDSMIERFLFRFLDDPTMANLRAAVAAGDIPVSFREAHTMKGVAANLAFTQLREAASQLTEQLRGQNAPADAALLAAVEQAYADVVNAIGAYRAQK